MSTTIRVSEKLKAILENMSTKKGESFDDIISILVSNKATNNNSNLLGIVSLPKEDEAIIRQALTSEILKDLNIRTGEFIGIWTRLHNIQLTKKDIPKALEKFYIYPKHVHFEGDWFVEDEYNPIIHAEIVKNMINDDRIVLMDDIISYPVCSICKIKPTNPKKSQCPECEKEDQDIINAMKQHQKDNPTVKTCSFDDLSNEDKFNFTGVHNGRELEGMYGTTSESEMFVYNSTGVCKHCNKNIIRTEAQYWSGKRNTGIYPDLCFDCYKALSESNKLPVPMFKHSRYRNVRK